MSLEQIVEIPPSRRLLVDVPEEVPVGRTILTFNPAPGSKDLEGAERIWAYNRAHPEEVKAKFQKLEGCLGGNAFGGLTGMEYQKKVREEWNDSYEAPS